MSSVTTTSVAVEGPSLRTAREKVSGSPMWAVAVCDLTIERSAAVVTSTTSAAVLLPGSGSMVGEVTTPVLVEAPCGAAGSIATVIVNGRASAPANTGVDPSRVQVTSCPVPVAGSATQLQPPSAETYVSPTGR